LLQIDKQYINLTSLMIKTAFICLQLESNPGV